MKPRKIPPFDILARLSEIIEDGDPDNEPLTFGKHKGMTPNEIFYDDPQYLIWLKKTGSAIPSQELYEEAFRPFSRLDETRSRNQKGVGLGLAIARDVARAHGGDISLSRSALGGLRATLRLPRPA